MTSSVHFLAARDQWREARAAYEDVLEAQISAADEACRGVLLSARAQASGITIRQLFLAPPQNAQAWASEELRDYWRERPRVTFAEFEREHYDSMWSGQWGA